VTREERLGPYTYRWGEESFPLTADSLELGAFVTLRPGDRVLDLGCGAGLLLLLCERRCPGLGLTGIEADPASAARARENLARNGLAGTVLTGDVGALELPRADVVVSNPPWFPAGAGAAAGGAKTEGVSLRAWCAAAAGALGNKGRFAAAYPPERLTDLFTAWRAVGVEPKRLQLLQHRRDTAPFAALVEGTKGGRPGLSVLPVKLSEEV